jgi:DNA-binding protein HU-beta
MPDDRFKKYQEAGVDFLETARARAEEFLRELSKAGESTQRQGRDTLEDVLEGSRKGTEGMITSIRNEIRSQLSLLGLATQEDLAALERRLGGSGSTKAAASKKSATAKKSSARPATAKKSAGAAKRATTKSTASKSTASKSTASKSTASKSGGAKRSSAAKATAKRSSGAKKASGRA